jgi:hypothetical protein
MDMRSQARMNAEGELTGGKPGIAWMLVNAGVTGAIAKETDDSVQLVIEALVSTATDASTAGLARIIAACTSGVFMVMREGRDVILPKYTPMDVVLTHALKLTYGQSFAGAQVPAHWISSTHPGSPSPSPTWQGASPASGGTR